jgi:hypothetical protein
MVAGGRIYPAKDSRMSARAFHLGFPKLAEFLPFVDPALSSAFARRVRLGEKLKIAA